MEASVKKQQAWYTAWQGIPAAWKWPVLAWASGSILVWGWMLVLRSIGFLFLNHPEGYGPSLLDAWISSDTLYYLEIAREGYLQPINSVYFPLYPFLGRWVHMLIGGREIAAFLLISSLSTLVFLLLLYRLVNVSWGERLAKRALVVAILFPTSFYLWSGYPHSLVMMLGTAAWYLTVRKKWWAACLAGFVAGLAHSTALIIVLPLFVVGFKYFWVEKGLKRWLYFLPAGFPILGILSFWIWRLAAGFGSFHQTEYEYFRRITRFPWQTLVKAVTDALPSGSEQMMPRINILFLVLLLCAFGWSIRRMPLEYQAHMAAGLGLGLMASHEAEALWSFARYGATIFPLFIVLSLWMDTRRARLMITALLLLGLLFLSAVFLSGAWVA